MKHIKKLIALFLAVSVVMSFMPTMAFAEDMIDEDTSEDEIFEFDYSMSCLLTKDGTDAKQDGNIITVGKQYVNILGFSDEADEISTQNPYFFKGYLLKDIGTKLYQVIDADDIVVMDAKGNILEDVVTKVEGSTDGQLSIKFVKEGYYTIRFVEESEHHRDIYEMTINLTDIGKLIKKIKASKISRINTSAKKGSITVAWDPHPYAFHFLVYRSTKKTSGFKKIASTIRLHHVDKKSLKKGKRYYYKVRGYADVEGKRVYTKYSSVVSRIAK